MSEDGIKRPRGSGIHILFDECLRMDRNYSLVEAIAEIIPPEKINIFYLVDKWSMFNLRGRWLAEYLMFRIPPEQLKLHLLLNKYSQANNDPLLDGLLRKLALSIPSNKLSEDDRKELFYWQDSKKERVRNLIWELLLKHFPDQIDHMLLKIIEQHGDESMKKTASLLLADLDEGEDRDVEASQFIEEHF
jgi:hypothetical protein